MKYIKEAFVVIVFLVLVLTLDALAALTHFGERIDQ